MFKQTYSLTTHTDRQRLPITYFSDTFFYTLLYLQIYVVHEIHDEIHDEIHEIHKLGTRGS